MRDQPDRFISGVGGTGSGTGLVGAGLLVGPDTTLGKILLLISPATSVIVGTTLYYLHVSLNRWLESRAAAAARPTLERAINNPLVPEEDKARFRNQLAIFEEGVIAREMERVRLIGTVPRRESP
jgi:hypothetical protein